MTNHVLITHKLHEPCEVALDEKFQTHRLYLSDDRAAFLRQVAPDVRAIAGGAVSAELMDSLPNLEMISNFGVGYDSIDVEAAKTRKIFVTNTPEVLNDAMAEITLGLMISLSRKIVAAHNFVARGDWPQGAYPLQSELRGKTVGIVGLGRIGKEIADRCVAMKMRAVYFGRRKQAHQPYIYYDSLVDMAKDSDWLVVITPGGPETVGLVNAQVLNALGPQGNLVNMARGSVVDQGALIDAIQSKRIAGAALDVFADEPNVPAELMGHDNVILSPHAGSATSETRQAMGDLVVANLEAYFQGKPLLSRVV